ncbi:glycoside hydrolase family 73 protein [Paucilactobacillus nenjiangensis]|uniref:N-acetylmuramidase n=1 Tax=Paucilactobacillus nenjiangensis TaxID=1296540 RepID=A0A5P1X3P6_9LACO|nr:glycoside hydrolase family 73 protein [Paucilactobacillus nenjiangensis]QER67081.1 N-acetylmuramidase [Paucilactobacillus nenjiangensis]
MAKRRRKKYRPTNFLFNRGHLKWKNLFVLLLAFFLVGYGVYELHQIRVEQEARAKMPSAKEQFIASVKPEAQAMMKQHHVYASITIAQAILESNWGKSTLAAKYYNLFGVKSDDPNNSKVLRTQEYVNGEWITINGRFQVYASWNASIDDHALLMVNGTTYNSQQYAQVIAATSYQDAAQALQNAGYATDPTYASKLISIIQKYKLDQYDS